MGTVFENIGFNITCEDDVYRLSDFVLNSGSFLTVDDGAYAVFSDKCGAEIWERVALNHEEKSVSLLNLDPHFNGSTVWRLEYVREFSAERDDALDCKALLKKPDSDKAFCARIMGALAAKQLHSGEEFDFQVSLIPHSIAFFENELSMRKALSDETTALGTIAPVGMYSRMIAVDDAMTQTDILVSRIAAEVKTGDVRFMIAGDRPIGEFLHITIDTDFGPLDVAVSQNYYETKELPRICEGGYTAVVFGIISAKLINKEKADTND
ncbi:MAG: hypothetical protein IIV97_03560 [Oscillospiraceae bacterium]|nr:hypothetical protein [Oscillospiraceae bacterium]